jgi:predicted Rossmann-fold nucleotide-binding protein
VASYFSPLLTLIQHASNEGFISPVHTSLLQVRESVEEVLEALAGFTPTCDISHWPELPPEG